MVARNNLISLIVLILLQIPAGNLLSQNIIYSPTDPDKTWNADIRIIGKIKDHLLIYKSMYRSSGYIMIYDNNMNFISKTQLNLTNEKLIALAFINSDIFSSVVFQVAEKGMIYTKVAMLDENGKISGEVKSVDTIRTGVIDNDLFSIQQSENKKHTLLSRSIYGLQPGKIQLDHLVLDEGGKIEKSDHFFIECSDSEKLSDPKIDNEGNIVFYKMKNNRMRGNLSFYRSSISNELEIKEFELNEHSFQVPMIKIDNLNGVYHIISLYKNNKSNNTIGLLLFNLLKDLSGDVKPMLFPFDRSLLKIADKEAPTETAFNSYFLKDFITTTHGGFAVTAVLNKVESIYQTRFASSNRRDGLVTTMGTGTYIGSGNYSYTPYEAIFRNNNVQTVQSHGTRRKHQLMIFTFDKNNHFINYAVPNKSTETPFAPTYSILNLSNEVLFVYNEVDKKNKVLLNNFSLDPGGIVTMNGIFRNLDKGYFFFPESGKQIDTSTMIIPCEQKGKLAFAMIKFDHE